MEREGQQGRVIPLRNQRVVKCHECGNENLLHGLTLAKASMVMMVGGPAQLPSFIDDQWAVYLCIKCQSFFPYPKRYIQQPKREAMYKQILTWCEAQSKLRKQHSTHLEKLVSIIESNKDLLGLTRSDESRIEDTLKPLMDRIDMLENEIRSKKGGRPKHCSVKFCKTKAERNGLCNSHYMEKSNE